VPTGTRTLVAGLVVDDVALAPVLRERARHLGVAHEGVDAGAGGVGGAAVARQAVARSAGSAHDVLGLALQ
jgi:hypothetical protein